ncbi:uncharacterized protein LOC583808 [Strongylocentrotus purpuratus]|uniref:Lipocalin/cytosolic fatty-acid binding domain-containing protein n=1 Tax=Strongylocentrotus purpuratus TaxID=7668 RepID=A0A7M7TGQ4_STRPU|nr:uncharacterized protein LOC583808 [Strongylocentrotus purpuratus]
MRVLCLLLLLGFASFSSAQTFGFRGCPRVSVARDFDLDRYFGLWSLITTSFRSDLTCVTAEYLPGDDGSIRVINSGRSQDGDVTSDEGTAFQPDPEEGAKLQILLYRGQTPQDYWFSMWNTTAMLLYTRVQNTSLAGLTSSLTGFSPVIVCHPRKSSRVL